MDPNIHKDLIEEIKEQADIFYSIIKQQYPSEEWLELTEAERNMLLYFNSFLLKYVAPEDTQPPKELN